MAERTSAPAKTVQRLFDMDFFNVEFFNLKTCLLDKYFVLDKSRLS